MGKILQLLSISSLALLTIGTALYPQNALFWMASGAPAFQQIRILLIVLLMIQLVTLPPRHVWFRLTVSAAASITTVWVILATNSFHMELLDSLVFLGAAFTAFATALERGSYAPRVVSILHNHNRAIA
jgi:hypothetical protein